MELYVRFISTLAFGLVGLGAVLKILLENVFEDWDVFHEVADCVTAACSAKPGNLAKVQAEDALLKAGNKTSTIIADRRVDHRRRRIKEMDMIETRLQARDGITDPGILPS